MKGLVIFAIVVAAVFTVVISTSNILEFDLLIGAFATISKDAETVCPAGDSLFKRKDHQDYICIPELTAHRWVELDLGEIVQKVDLPQQEDTGCPQLDTMGKEDAQVRAKQGEAGVVKGNYVTLKNTALGTTICVKPDKVEKYISEGWVRAEQVDADSETLIDKNLHQTVNDAATFNHDFEMTDPRFEECIKLHSLYQKLVDEKGAHGETAFREEFADKSYLDTCINLYKQTMWTNYDKDHYEALYNKFLDLDSHDSEQIDFSHCIHMHKDYVTEGESTFKNKNSKYSYMDSCIKLYKDPVWQVNSDDRSYQLYSKYLEIVGKPNEKPDLSSKGHTEILSTNDVGSEKFMVKFNACAGDQVITHANILLKSGLESIQIGSYKDIFANTCRTYESTIHAKHANLIKVTILDHQTKDTKELFTGQKLPKTLACDPTFFIVDVKDGKPVCVPKIDVDPTAKLALEEDPYTRP